MTGSRAVRAASRGGAVRHQALRPSIRTASPASLGLAVVFSVLNRSRSAVPFQTSMDAREPVGAHRRAPVEEAQVADGAPLGDQQPERHPALLVDERERRRLRIVLPAAQHPGQPPVEPPQRDLVELHAAPGQRVAQPPAVGAGGPRRAAWPARAAAPSPPAAARARPGRPAGPPSPWRRGALPRRRRPAAARAAPGPGSSPAAAPATMDGAPAGAAARAARACRSPPPRSAPARPASPTPCAGWPRRGAGRRAPGRPRAARPRRPPRRRLGDGSQQLLEVLAQRAGQLGPLQRVGDVGLQVAEPIAGVVALAPRSGSRAAPPPAPAWPARR